MKIMVLTDLEGPSGVNGRADNDSIGNQIVNPVAACQALTEEVNACVQGLVDGGAEEIVVWDGHGPSNSIDILRLQPPALLGTIGGPMQPVCCCDASFDAVVQLGAHAMQGIEDGYMCHSFNSHGVCNLWLNGERIGEIGIQAYLAAYFGLPTILVSGDAAGCREAREVLPGVSTVVTKKAFSRYTAINRNPQAVREELRQAACQAMRKISESAVLSLSEKLTLRIEFMCANLAAGCEMRGWKRLDHKLVETTSDDFVDLFAQYCGWAPGVHNRKYGITPQWTGLAF